MMITFFALLIGLVIGIVIATVRSTFDKNREEYKKKGGFFYFIWWIVNAICNIYLTVVRGTPVVVQLLICYFIVFASSRNGVAVAIFAFGINSGAYMAELIRSGINAVDRGQMEAARSLGLSYWRSMFRVVLPQAIKNMIPSIVNQFIITLKDTSILSVIGFPELVNKAQNVIAITFKSFQTWAIVAVMYLVVILTLQQIANALERRLSRGRKL